MSRKPRVAIYGGDERNESLDWPEHLDVHVYPYKSPRSMGRLQESLASGSVDHLVVLTSYVGHGFVSGLKSSDVHTIQWPRSPGQLCREIGRLIPPPPPTDPLLIPTSPDHPGTGGGRGPLPAKETTAVETPEQTIVRAEETLGQALRRILGVEGMSQSELARMLNRPQATVSQWFTDKSKPRDLGPLVGLWPELARFDTRQLDALAAAKEAESDRELIRSVSAEPKARPQKQPQPQDPGRLIGAELAAALGRWRRAKEELETTERYLLMLLRDSGL